MKKLTDKLASFRNDENENEEGFTLIELVIVVAIIGILTAIAIPAYGAIQATARDNSTKAAATDTYTAALAQLAQGTAPSAVVTSLNSTSGDIDLAVTATGEEDVVVTAIWAPGDTPATVTSAPHAWEVSADGADDLKTP